VHVDIKPTGASVNGTPVSKKRLESSGAFRVDYSLVLLVNDRLYFGKNDGALDGKRAENRPLDVDRDYVLVRQ